MLHRPSKGWDPVPVAHAECYAAEQWRNVDTFCIDSLEKRLGPLRGKRVLDLGGGPGHFSVAFASRGALVTWHDVSRRYLEIAHAKSVDHGVDISFFLGYLEDAKSYCETPFDLVFCRICWRYCRSDRAFASLVFSLVAPGGACYIDTTVGPDRASRSWQHLKYLLNAHCGVKIGHPNPPPHRLRRYFSGLSAEVVDVGSSPTNDRLLCMKKIES